MYSIVTVVNNTGSHIWKLLRELQVLITGKNICNCVVMVARFIVMILQYIDILDRYIKYLKLI